MFLRREVAGRNPQIALPPIVLPPRRAERVPPALPHRRLSSRCCLSDSAQQLGGLVTSGLVTGDLVPIMDGGERLGFLPPAFPRKEEALAA